MSIFQRQAKFANLTEFKKNQINFASNRSLISKKWWCRENMLEMAICI